MFNEIFLDPNIEEEEKEKYKELKKKIKQNDYFYCYEDISAVNLNIPRILEEKQLSIENPFILYLPETLNYDVELFKIGKNCGGLKKRYAIIKKGGFYSSKKPIKEMESNKIKDKTEYIKGSLVIIEYLESYDRNQGEWSNKQKPFRIRIIYLDDPKEKITKIDLKDKK